MAKYVINIDDDLPSDPQFLQVIRAEPNGQVRITYIEFDTLEPFTDEYIDKHSRDLQDDAYERGYNVGFKEGIDAKQRRRRDADEKLIEQGRNEAWEAARKIDDMNGNERHDCFGIAGIAFKLTASEAIAKLEAYEEKKKAADEIKVGDEVIYNKTTVCIVLTPETDKKYASIVDDCGCHYSADHRELTKTGRHFPEVAELLKKMKGGGEWAN